MTSIRELQLSARASNCLKYQDIETIEDLQRYSAKQLLEIENFGIVSLNEVAEALLARGIHLAGFTPRKKTKHNIEPLLKTKTIKISYWTCTVNEHQHQTKNAAVMCIQRMTRNPVSKQTSSRDMRITNEVLSGRTAADVAHEYGLSNARIMQIVFTQCRRANYDLYQQSYGISDLRANRTQFFPSH